MTEKRKFSAEEMRTLLTSVFGPDILATTKSPHHTDDPQAWRLSSSDGYNSAHLVMDIPEFRRAELADKLRAKLHVNIWRKDANGAQYTPEGVATMNGRADQCIDGYCRINLNALEQLHAEGIKYEFHGEVRQIMQMVMDHETDWIAYKKHVVGKVNRLILGENHIPGYWQRGFKITPFRSMNKPALSLDLIWGPTNLQRYDEFKDKQHVFWIDMERFYNNKANDLGVLPFIRYDSYHVGGHGPIDEETLMIPFNSAEDLTLKLDKLDTDPAFLAQVKSFVAIVLRDVVAEWAMPQDKLFHRKLDKMCPLPKNLWKGEFDKAARDEIMGRRKVAAEALLQKPEHAAWRSLSQRTQYNNGMSIGDLLQELRNPPEGTDDVTRQVYAKVLKSIKKEIPLLAEPVAAAPQPAPAAKPGLGSGPA